MISDKTDDDAYVFWYKTPAAQSGAAFAALLTLWVKAGVVPRQGTPVEVSRRVEGGAVQVKQHPPPTKPEDVEKIFAEYGTAPIPQVKAQADLYLAGAVVRARLEFEYLGEDELAAPRVDPRRDFMQGVLFLPQYWRERAKGYEGADPGGAAALIEDALLEKYLQPLAEQTGPLSMLSGPEHDNVRWRFTEAELARPRPARLSEIARYATYLAPDQVARVGPDHLERVARVFAWLHGQEPRIKPVCRLTANGGALLSRWPGALDREPKFASMLAAGDRASLNHVREALAPQS